MTRLHLIADDFWLTATEAPSKRPCVSHGGGARWRSLIKSGKFCVDFGKTFFLRWVRWNHRAVSGLSCRSVICRHRNGPQPGLEIGRTTLRELKMPPCSKLLQSRLARAKRVVKFRWKQLRMPGRRPATGPSATTATAPETRPATALDRRTPPQPNPDAEPTIGFGAMVVTTHFDERANPTWTRRISSGGTRPRVRAARRRGPGHAAARARESPSVCLRRNGNSSQPTTAELRPPRRKNQASSNTSLMPSLFPLYLWTPCSSDTHHDSR